MAQTFLLYSIRQGGWWLKSGVHGSDWRAAQEFTWGGALERCKKHVDHDRKPELIMVDKATVEETLEK